MTDHEPRLTQIRQLVRDVPDFPKPGILFRDLTPVMKDPAAFRLCIELLAERISRYRPEVIVAIESRGFIFGAPVAAALQVGFAPVRKPGKLPWRTARRSYALEYGTDSLEMHVDAVRRGGRAVILDDLLATGGTAAATVELVREQGAEVAALAVVVELAALGGRAKLGNVPTESLITY